MPVLSKRQQVYDRAVRLSRLLPRTLPDEWGARNRVYAVSSGHPGRRDPKLTPYLIPFARAIASTAYKRVIGVTAAQSGKTENLLDVIGQRLDQRPVPTLYVGPTRDFLVDRFEPRLMDLFDQAPTLRDKIVRGRRMKKLTKWVSGVQVRLAYAGSAQALKSDPIGLALVDKYDGMLAVQKSGDPLVLIEARGATYADFTVGVVSPPSRGRLTSSRKHPAWSSGGGSNRKTSIPRSGSSSRRGRCTIGRGRARTVTNSSSPASAICIGRKERQRLKLGGTPGSNARAARGRSLMTSSGR